MSDSDWSIDPEDEPMEYIHAQQLPPGYEDCEEQSPAGMYGHQAETEPVQAPRTSNYAYVVPRLPDQESGLRATRPLSPHCNVRARIDSQETVNTEDDVASVAEPADDYEATELFKVLEKDSWKSVGKSFFCYDYSTGTWGTDNNGPSMMRHLLTRHGDVLGKYRTTVRCMDQVIKLCSGQNLVDSSWFNKLDTQFSIGEMAYSDGVYNIMTRELRPLTPASLVHRKLNKNAPSHAATPGGTNWMRTKINQLFPEENSRIEVMRRFAETGFTTTNKDKYVVQLYGDGDNGKSTLAAIAKAVWPQYNETVVPNSLNAGRQTSEISTWAIKFHGARWVWQDEGTCDGVLDACLIKKIRGGAALQGRVTYGPLIDVVPTWKLWLMGNDIAEIKPMDSATEKSIFTVEMIPTFMNDAADIARAKAGVHAAYVFPKDPDLLDRFKELDIQYAFTEICAEYLQMCVDSMASVGQYFFPPLESEHISRDMYAEENQSPESIFERVLEVTGDKTDTISADYMYPRFKSENYAQSKNKFKDWMRKYATKLTSRGVVFVCAHNKPFFRGVKFRDVDMGVQGGVDLAQL